MSENPKGGQLPESLIKGLKKIAAKEEYETKAERRKRLAAERKFNVVSEKAPEVIDVAGEVVEDSVGVWERPEKGVKENVSGRMGGLNSRIKADEELESAREKDIDRNIFERAKVFAENKKGATKRPLKENLAKVDFKDPDEIKRELPDPDSIEDAEFNIDQPKEKKLKEDVNRRVGGFDSRQVASRLVEKANYDDYQSNLEESFKKASSIDELLEIIDTEVDDKRGLQGTQDNFKKSDLKMIIQMLRDKEPGVGIEHVTRSAGLRQKVFDLLNENQETTQTTTPKNKYITGEEVPVAPDVVDGKIDQSEVGYDFQSTEDSEDESEVELKPVKIEGAKEASKIVKKNSPLVGSDQPPEHVYSPEQFSKKAEVENEVETEDDPNVFRLPKNESGIEVNNELPDAPLEPLSETKNPLEFPKIESDDSEMSEEEKNFLEIKREVAKLEGDLDLKRKILQRSIFDKSDLDDSFEGHPFKKFWASAISGEVKKYNLAIEKAAEDFKKLTEELIESKTDRRLYELNSMHPNTKERKEVEMIRLVDVPKDLLVRYPEATEVFEENGKVIHIKTLNKAAIKLPKEFKEAINEIYPDIVRSKVWLQIRDDHRASEKQDLIHYLLDN